MLGTIKSLVTTMKLAFKPSVTAEYPTVAPTLAPRFMAHPVLTWDKDVPEPYCTGCLVCMRICPTDCIDVAMMDNPKHAEGDSSRRKIVDYFDLNVADCIMCGLCVEYCNFDAIIMSDHFDASEYARPNLVMDLELLLDQGKEQEAKGRWSPPEAKKSQRRTAAQGGAAAAGADASGADRVAASRAKAAELRAQRAAERGEAPPAEVSAPAAEPITIEEPKAVDPRVVESRRRTAELKAQRAAERGEAAPTEASAPATESGSTEAKPVDPRVAESRAKAAELRAQRAAERAVQEAANTDNESDSNDSKPGTDAE